MNTMRHSVLTVMLAVMVIAAGCEVGVNADISIPAEAESDGVAVINGRIDVGSAARVSGNLSTVNGPVIVGSRATVGEINTINGGVRLAAGAICNGVNTINGDIRLAEEAMVRGSVALVQGEVALAAGAEIAGDLDSVGGAIRLRDARVGGDIATVTADITLAGSSVVDGDIRIENRNDVEGDGHRPRIVIGPGSRVLGVLDLEDPADVYLSEDAEIGGVEGTMTEEDIVRFSGPEPGPQ